MSQSENAAWVARICAEMEEVGAFVAVLAGSAVSSGLPDRLVAWRGFLGLLEFKGVGDTLRVNQRLTAEGINRRASGAFIVQRVRAADGGFSIFLYAPFKIKTLFCADCRDTGAELLLECLEGAARLQDLRAEDTP